LPLLFESELWQFVPEASSLSMKLPICIAAVLVFSVLAIAASAQQSETPTGSSPSSDQSPQTTQPQPTTSTSLPSAPQAQQSQMTQQQPLSSEEVLRQEEKQRALGVVPMFGMTSIRNAPPLSTSQKFRLMARSLLDPFTFVAAGLQAGVGQAEDSFPEYGQGAKGYAKRYGASWADGADSNLFSNFVYPSLFKQDPRYFRLGEGSVKRRLVYAVVKEFVARKDSGGDTVHFSNILGAFTAGTISNAYYPQSDRGVGLTASRAVIALGWGTLGDALLEFWPDIDRKLFHRSSSLANQNEPPGGPPK
jgi:hypothetical protein